MRAAILVLAALCMNANAQTGTLTKAEKLTDQQKQALVAAENKVSDAQAELDKVKAQIAAEHNCVSESWMEWSTSCYIDGDFLLQRHYSSYLNANAINMGR